MTQDAYEVVAGSPRHIRRMAKDLRAAACVTIADFGFDPRRALHRIFVQSFYCRTALVAGRPIAMWGVVGSLLSPNAFVWLVLSKDVGLLPVRLVRDARAELARIMKDYDEVSTTVLPDDEAAINFAVCLGFHDREGDDAPKRRRDMVAAIRANPRYKVAVGDHFAIALGYHPGAN
jgi:hypothetical protein